MSKKHKQPGDAELLAELATLDEVSARIPTATEHDAGVVPPWCELILEVKRGSEPVWPYVDVVGAHPIIAQWALRRHDGELIIEVLDQVLHPQRNPRGVEAIWAALDAVVDRIQARLAKDKRPKDTDIGVAYGLASALAMYTGPRSPDVDAVRAEAMSRWDARNGVA